MENVENSVQFDTNNTQATWHRARTLSVVSMALLFFSIFVFVIYLVFSSGNNTSKKAILQTLETLDSINTSTPTVEQREDTMTIASQVCGLSFEYPKDWQLEVNDDKDNYCLYRIKDPSNEKGIVSLYSGGYVFEGWEGELTKLLGEAEINDNVKQGEIKFEKLQLLLGSAYKQSTYVVGEKKLTSPVISLIFGKGKNTFMIEYIQVNHDFEKKVENLIQSIIFTKSNNYYDTTKLNNYIHASISRVNNKSDDLMKKAKLRQIKTAIDLYKKDKLVYPANLSILVSSYLKEIPNDMDIEYVRNQNQYTLTTVLSDNKKYMLKSD